MQGLVAEWVDPAPNQLIPQANHKLLELCGSVLLPAAIRMSLEAARLVTALINALFYGVSDVVATIETTMRDPRDRDRDDDDHRGRRETGRGTGERGRPTGAEQRGHREDRRSDGNRQRNTEHRGRRHAGEEAKQAVDGSAGLTITTPPTTGTWPRVRLFLQITNVEWTLTLYVSPGDFKTPLQHASSQADTTPFLDTSPTPTAEPCALLFTGAPTVVRPDSSRPRSAPPKAAPTTMTTAARQDALRRLLEKPDAPPRAATPPPKINKPAVARLLRPQLPRVKASTPVVAPPSAGPMATQTVPPPSARVLPPPPPRDPAVDGPDPPSREELAVSRADAQVRLIVTEQEAMRGQLVSNSRREDVETRLAAARANAERQRDIFSNARRQMERALGGPLPQPPLPERPSAGGTRAERETIQKAQFNQVMGARQETDARVWEYAAQHDIAGLVDERRRRTKENLSRSGGSRSGGSKSGGSGDKTRGRTTPPRRGPTRPRTRTPPRVRDRTPPRAATPPRDRTRSEHCRERQARDPSPPPRRRLRSDSRDRDQSRPPSKERRPGKSGRGDRK
jgi:hypothetical protein